MLVNIDKKALEWRAAVCLSGDKIGTTEILDEIDFHSHNRDQFGLPTRFIAKIYLFRTIYRGPAWAFANDPQFSPVSSSTKFWQGVEDKFFEKYNGLDKWHKRLYEQYNRMGYVGTPSGRRYYIPLKKTKQGLDLDKSAITNYPVQGFSADLVMLSRIVLFNRIKNLNKLGFKALLINSVHDSLLVDCPDEEVPVIVQNMYEVTDRIAPNSKKFFYFPLLVPIDGEVKIGKDYANMDEVKRNGDVLDKEGKVIYNISSFVRV